MELADHLFRQEAGRLTAALTKVFGIHNLDLVEDVVQEAFVQALRTWSFRGLPENPAAWLMTAARRKAIDALRRERTARSFAPELGKLLESEWTLVPTVAEVFEPGAIKDEQLRMMFSCCHPRLGEESQVALMLNILCGFSVDEIAGAYLSSHAAIEKRIPRAKKALAELGVLFDIASAEDFAARLPAVQRALYLLFNEGYHGASAQDAVRVELCDEALRLCGLLVEHPQGRAPSSCALAALMNLHAARLPARLDSAGQLRPLMEQDRASWDQARVAEGLGWLAQSAQGAEASAYHLEAGIAAMHAQAATPEETDWQQIVGLYDALMAVAPSPVVALNRAIAVGQHSGPEAGLEAMGAIGDAERLLTYPFYHAAQGEMEHRRGAHAAARGHFTRALEVARNDQERRHLERRIAACAGAEDGAG